MRISTIFTSRSSRVKSPTLRVHTESIGRSATGKTTAYTAVNHAAADEHLPSGLFFSSGDDDPAGTIGRLNETRHRIHDLAGRGLDTTLADRVATYHVSDGEEPRVQFDLFECIGQVLTDPDRDARTRAKYEEYVRRLPQAQCLWVFTPLPHAGLSGAEEEQFQYDVKVSNAYLRSALKLRTRSSAPLC